LHTDSSSEVGPHFYMTVDFMRPVYNLEPKYRVTILAREEWTRSLGTPPAVKGLVWYTDGSRTAEGTGAGVCGQSVIEGSVSP
jgi:hypothetical protein